MGGLTIKKKLIGEADNFSTNKVAKLITPKIDVKKIAIEHKDMGITILKPSIDRMIFSFDPDEKLLVKYGYNDPEASVEYKEYIKKSLVGDAYATAHTQLTHVTGVSFFKPPYKNYDVNLLFKPSATCEPILVQICPKNPSWQYFRFDMNPNRISKGGFAAFWSWIDDLLVFSTGEVVSREDFLIWSKVYSVEVAVEILGVRPDDLEMHSVAYKKVKPAKAHLYNSAKGRTETYYFNAKPGKKSTEYVYDKRTEMIEAGNEPLYGDLLHSRFECRIGKTRFHKLPKLTNRCARASIKALDKSAFKTLSFEKQQFLKLSLKSSQEKALSLIPDAQQADFQKAYTDHVRNIWDAKMIWSYWKATLASSGLLGQVEI